MKAIMPSVVVKGDVHRIMARGGELCGFSKSRCVWRFGFLDGSDHSLAYGVHVVKFDWYITNYHGRMFDHFNGFAYELPDRYNTIISKKL